VSERLGEVLLAERQLSGSPDLGVRLEVLLDLSIKSTSLQSDDLRGGIRVVGDGRAALGAEETVDDVARRALGAGVGLDGTVDGELVLLDNSNKRVGGTALALAVVAVVVANNERLVIDLVGDGFAEAVSRERHCERFGISSDKLAYCSKSAMNERTNTTFEPGRGWAF
jgi:hypothetical protein